MQNLLRTLTDSKAKAGYPDCDLRLLLTTVKDGRRQTQDSKLTDPFYDSLEGLLLDLRTTTIDNHDAEAFLKPVSKSEVPDYYDVIANPMDLQTMLKKVKNKGYKSKREFKDDLDLIWSNCLMYNAVETHPLRQCAKRLKVKADRLLRNITDHKERTNPAIPAALGGTGTSAPSATTSARASPFPTNNAFSTSKTNGHRTPTITIKPPRRTGSASAVKRDKTPQTPFAEMPALVRTAEGMRAWAEVDADPDPARLAAYLSPGDREAVVKQEEEDDGPMDGEIGDKRRWSGPNDRPRKRSRHDDADPHIWWAAVHSDALLPNAIPAIAYPASLPPPLFLSHYTASSRPRRKKHRDKCKGEAKAADGAAGDGGGEKEKEKTLLGRMNANIRTMRRLRHTHARFAALGFGAPDEAEPGAGGAPPPMDPGPSAGIAAEQGLGQQAEDAEAGLVGADEVDARAWGAELGIGGSAAGRRRRRGKARAVDGLGGPAVKQEYRDGRVKQEYRDGRVKQEFGSQQERQSLQQQHQMETEPEEDVGLDIGGANAESCMQWMGGKVLEHAGFQGTSKLALDVLASVTSEYLLNVGRTMRYMCDKYSHTMTAEEIILHTLFESGIGRVQDLESYISDDVERYGTRLGDLEKKLVGAYREVTAVDMVSDEGMFDDEDEEGGALTMGDFADALGEDYLGLRELGIAAEFGMSNLSVPKRLLRGKKRAGVGVPGNAAPAPPPLPFPLPPPFVPLTPGKVDSQIGLLRGYYLGRFSALAASAAQLQAPPPPPPLVLPPLAGPLILPPLAGPQLGAPPAALPPLPGPQLGGLPPLPGPQLGGPPAALPPLSGPPGTLPQIGGTPPDVLMPPQPPPPPAAPPVILPHLQLHDDPPTPAHAKMGPLGQILIPKASTKKKVTIAAGAAGGGGGGAKKPDAAGGDGGVRPDGEPKKKKKGATGVGTGNGRKKNGSLPGKGDGALMPPPPVPAPIVAAGV